MGKMQKDTKTLSKEIAQDSSYPDKCKTNYENLKGKVTSTETMLITTFSEITTVGKFDVSDVGGDFGDANDKVGDELYKIKLCMIILINMQKKLVKQFSLLYYLVVVSALLYYFFISVAD